MLIWCLAVLAIVGIRVADTAPLNHEPTITVISQEDSEDIDEYAPGMFEGDIDVSGYNPRYRVAITSRTRLWPNGIVPYTLHSNYTSDVAQRIRGALTNFQNELRSGNDYCIRFVERTTESDYISVEPRSGCSSAVGHMGGAQRLSLGRGCWASGTVKHEFMHAMGFWHEQSSPNRDSHITIVWDNIQDGKSGNFKKHTTNGDTQGLPYDLLSIMHYGPFTFRKHRSKPTMFPQQQGLVMGQRRGLSEGNVREIQLKYGCSVDTSHVRSPTLPRVGAVFDCNFETDMCGLTNEGDFNWQRRVGPTKTNDTGPYTDRTSGNGYYLYARAANHLRQTARFSYPEELTAGKYCLTFQSWIYGATGMQPLTVVAETAARRQNLVSVKFKNYNNWRRNRVTLTVSGTWRLYFEVTPTVKRGDIAIDDLELLRGACPRYT